VKEKPDFKDVEAGPLDENNRECRDVFCCLLFFLCICGMVYCTIHAYLNGNPSKVFRGVAGDKAICGEVGGAAQNYPYLYFFNPLDSTDNRYCLKECPYFDGNGNLVLTECYPGHTFGPGCSQYNLVIFSNGSISTNGSVSSSSYIGYGSFSAIDRVCIPNTEALSVALKDVVANISSTLQSGQFATIVHDVKNVKLINILELAMAFSSHRLCCCLLLNFYDPA
jgi:hypothetical protein